MEAERVFNVLLGVCFIGWTLIGSKSEINAMGITTARISIIVLNGVVGFNFIIRRTGAKSGGPTVLFTALPSILVGSLAYRLAAPAVLWPFYVNFLFVFGMAITVCSLIFLGKNFAVFPALRGITQTGPYRFIRHPAYLGELLLIFTLILTGPRWGTLLFLFFIPLIVVRIIAEEKLLCENEIYKKYKRLVRWRLLYGIW